jgi:KDO2-lipid IV(A) lauroyltransferase
VLGAWLLIACAWLLARLPLRWLMRIGQMLGRLAFLASPSRRHVTRVNIGLCFPELDTVQQAQLTRDVFRHAGVALVESLVAWLNPHKPVARRWTVTGIEHVRAAAARGRGVLLVGAHFSAMDFASQTLAGVAAIDVIYRANKNPAWEWLQVHGRHHYFEGVIERNDVRGMLRRLKAGRVVWYAADQDYGRRHSVFAPFFGIPAASITATARLARLNDSPVLFMRQHRNLAELTWELAFSPVLEGYPSGDDQVDAARINALIESAIRRDPAQYLWLHRRFKTRPAGEPRLY